MPTDFTVEQVLRHQNIDPGNRGLCKCPLCDPKREHGSSFSYRGEVWHCFRCHEKGNAISLMRKLSGWGWSASVRALGGDPRAPEFHQLRERPSSPSDERTREHRALLKKLEASRDQQIAEAQATTEPEWLPVRERIIRESYERWVEALEEKYIADMYKLKHPPKEEEK